ncbi:MAG: aldo/keto reductase [Limisphaerales bacterium]
MKTPEPNSRTGLSNVSRRRFVKMALAAGAAVAAAPQLWSAETKGEIPLRPLGRTGEKVSAIGLGGYHIGIQSDEQLSLSIVRSAIDRGITFMDNCWDYNDGVSELRMGKALRDGYRDKVFLMTKIDGRTKALAAKQIEESLKRLQTDHLDLLQFHEIVRATDPDPIFASGGALEAVLEAKQAGKVRFIGFTGHKDPAIHLRMLAVATEHHFRFDAVQMPLNVMDAHFQSFEQQVVPKLVADGVGVLGMKALGFGDILRSNTVSAMECLQYALNLPTATVITGIDRPEILDQAVTAAQTFKPMSKERVSDLLARTAEAAAAGNYERFKTTAGFDNTTRNPDWTGT